MQHRRMAGLVALLLALSGCTKASSAPDAASSKPVSSAFPMTITDDDGVKVTIDHAPTRIVTFAPSMTEIVYALGLGDEVVGVSGPYDNYPSQAATVEQVGGAGDFGVDPDVEKVVALQPDLFLTIAGGDQWKVKLRDLGIPVVTLNATGFDDLVHDIRTVGTVTGAVQPADALATKMEADGKAVTAQVAAEPAVSCFYEVYFPPLTTVGPNTFIYDLLERAGCDPVSSAAKSDYPEWSVDDLVAEGPAVYIATDESGVDVRQISKRAGFSAIPAIANGRVVIVTSDLISRPGPRVVEGLQQLADALHPAA